MATEWIKINEYDKLFPGDIVRFTYTTTGLSILDAYLLSRIESKLEKNKNIRLIGSGVPADKDNEVYFNVEVLKETQKKYTAGVPVLVVAGWIVGALAGLGLVVWLNLKEVSKQKIVEKLPEGSSPEQIKEALGQSGILGDVNKILLAVIAGILVVRFTR